MSNVTDSNPYNDLLFAGGIRQAFHQERFLWLANALRERNLTNPRILEIGCNDGRSIAVLEEHGILPSAYLGVDANVQGGIDLAVKKWALQPNLEFKEAWSGKDIPTPDSKYDVLISLETLEHMPEANVDDYLARAAEIVDGWLFITVPIERGLAFVMKTAGRAVVAREALSLNYTPKEIFQQAIGRPALVEHDHHKGFDDRRVVRQVAKFFDIIKVTKVRPPLPLRTIGFQTAIIAHSRAKR